jgi:tRNA(Ile)-lysidine synthase TilS/MesJ
MSQSQFEETQVQERICRQYGLALGLAIIKVADKIQSDNNSKWSYEKCSRKAIRWVFDTFTREQIADLQNN